MLKLRENKTIGKYFDTDCRVYSGVKDAYGNTCYLVVNNLLNEFRIVGKNPYYSADRKRLPKFVIVPKYLSVIDLKRSTARALEIAFPDYIHPMWTIWDD